jgi:hypothetical protein
LEGLGVEEGSGVGGNDGIDVGCALGTDVGPYVIVGTSEGGVEGSGVGSQP